MKARELVCLVCGAGLEKECRKLLDDTEDDFVGAYHKVRINGARKQERHNNLQRQRVERKKELV